MFGDHDINHRNGSERRVRGRHFISGTFGNYSVSIDHPKPKKVIYKIVAYSLGLSGSGYLLYFNVGGWHASVLWLIMGAFWFVQFLRACLKLYFEYKEGQIEMEAKRDRYKKDIFT